MAFAKLMFKRLFILKWRLGISKNLPQMKMSLLQYFYMTKMSTKYVKDEKAVKDIIRRRVSLGGFTNCIKPQYISQTT
jgi:hypothetical protein